MIFSKKLRKTAASVLALVMVFAMSTGAFAYGGLQDSTDDNSDGYYTVTVSYTVEDLGEDLPDDAQISIIALAGAENENATVTFDTTTNTANNVLWIDQQAVDKVNGGSFTFQVKATDAANGFNVKSGVTGGGTMYDYVTIATQEPDDDEKSNNATLSAITVNGTVANLTDKEATYELASNAATAKIGYTAAAGATAVITGADNEGNVTLTAGVNTITITVTAEDGTTTETYTLKITNPEAGSTDPVDPPAGGETIEKEDITIGGAAVTDPSATITSTTPFGITNGHIVNVNYAKFAANETPTEPTMVVANGVKTDGVETFYTEYEINGETVIKLVTIITDPELKASDLTLVEGKPEKLVYGDPSANGTVGGEDIVNLINYILGKSAPNDHRTRLSADPSGNSSIGGEDIVELINVILGKRKYPSIVK